MVSGSSSAFILAMMLAALAGAGRVGFARESRRRRSAAA
jgi:hypothetical protein